MEEGLRKGAKLKRVTWRNAHAVLTYCKKLCRFCLSNFPPKHLKDLESESSYDLDKFQVMASCLLCTFRGENSRKGVFLGRNDLQGFSARERRNDWLATTLYSLGAALTREHDLSSALAYIENSRILALDRGSLVLVAKCEFLMSQIAQDRGLYQSSLEHCERAREIFDHGKSMLGISYCRVQFAEILFQLGERDRALENAELAWSYFRERPQSTCLCHYYLTISFLLSQLGKPELGIQPLTPCYPQWQMHEKSSALMDLDVALAFKEMGHVDKAIELFLSAKNQALAADPPALWLVADSEGFLAQIYWNLGDVDRTISYSASAQRIYQEIGDVEHAALLEAFAARAVGNFDKALKGYQKAAESLGPGSHPKWYCHWAQGQMLANKGEILEAFEAFDQALGLIETTRRDVSDWELKAATLRDTHEAYTYPLFFALRVGDHDRALSYVERLKSRNLVEMLEKDSHERLQGTDITSDTVEQGKIQHPWKIENSRPSYADGSISSQEVRRLVQDKESALVYLFPVMEKTAFLVIVRDKETVSGYFDHYSHADLLHDLDHTNRICRHRSPEQRQAMQSVLEKLYERIFVPLEPHLTDVHRITFVPYSAFHLLPLHAMSADKGGEKHYILDDYLVNYAPSAKILQQCSARRPGQSTVSFVGSSDPWGDLRLSLQESEAIAQLLGARLFRQATRQDLVDGAAPARIIHFSGHSGGDHLAMCGKDDGETVDPFTVLEIFDTLRLPEAFLVTLSACDTSSISVASTDEYIGLPSAFLHAGAPTVISSLWPVSDISTTLLMVRTYKSIHKGLGKAESLCNAQRWLKNPKNRAEHLQELEKLLPWSRPAAGKPLPDAMRFKGSRLSAEKLLPENLTHPYYWAGFICTGAS